MSNTKNDIPKNLMWLDLEMTGLEPSKDVILEVAAILNNFEFNELSRYETGVKQDEALIRKLLYENEWSRNRPAETEAEIKTSINGKSPEAVEEELLSLINNTFGNETVYLAGNSIHADRGFIKQYWPKLHARLHYRMLDVSSFKIWWTGTGHFPYVKKELHTALSDTEESIAELKFYLSKLNKL